jgi:hypothetical protein
MGVPMPGQEWILFQGNWGVDGDTPPGPGTPAFVWFDDRPVNPPAVWKVPDQVASVGVPTTFEIGKVLFYQSPWPEVMTIEIDWGDGIITEYDGPLPCLLCNKDLTEEHTYTAPGDYLVNVTVIGDDLWGGNVFKVTVSP